MRLTTSGGGDIVLGDITAAGDIVVLQAAGAVVDGDATDDVTAGSLSITAASGIGSGKALQTTVGTLAADNTAAGHVRIDNVGAADHRDGDGLRFHGQRRDQYGARRHGGDHQQHGDQRAAERDGDRQRDALGGRHGGDAHGQRDPGGPRDRPLADIRVTLNAGDDVSIPLGATVQAGTNIVINVDGSAGTDADAAIVSGGSTVNLGGTAIVGNVSLHSLTVNGGADNDTFNLLPQAGAPVNVEGNPPVFGGSDRRAAGGYAEPGPLGLNPPLLALGDEPGEGRSRSGDPSHGSR